MRCVCVCVSVCVGGAGGVVWYQGSVYKCLYGCRGSFLCTRIGSLLSVMIINRCPHRHTYRIPRSAHLHCTQCWRMSSSVIRTCIRTCIRMYTAQ